MDFLYLTAGKMELDTFRRVKKTVELAAAQRIKTAKDGEKVTNF